jgi:hypothetical protein
LRRKMARALSLSLLIIKKGMKGIGAEGMKGRTPEKKPGHE